MARYYAKVKLKGRAPVEYGYSSIEAYNKNKKYLGKEGTITKPVTNSGREYRPRKKVRRNSNPFQVVRFPF